MYRPCFGFLRQCLSEVPDPCLRYSYEPSGGCLPSAFSRSQHSSYFANVNVAVLLHSAVGFDFDVGFKFVSCFSQSTGLWVTLQEIYPLTRAQRFIMFSTTAWTSGALTRFSDKFPFQQFPKRNSLALTAPHNYRGYCKCLWYLDIGNLRKRPDITQKEEFPPRTSRLTLSQETKSLL